MLHAYYMVQSLANKWFGLDVLQSPYVHLEQTAHAMLSHFRAARFRVTRGHVCVQPTPCKLWVGNRWERAWERQAMGWEPLGIGLGTQTYGLGTVGNRLGNADLWVGNRWAYLGTCLGMQI